MAGFLKTLAVSVGSGLVLGATIRMGEAIAGSAREKRQPEPVLSPETPPEWRTAISTLTERLERHQADVESIRSHLGKTAGLREGLRGELQREISEDLDCRLAAVEEKLHLRMKAATRDTANAMAASIEMRVTPRISQLETEVGRQSTALAELRDCSLQSERSIQRLLTVLERTISSRSQPESAVVGGRGQDEGRPGSGAVKRPA